MFYFQYLSRTFPIVDEHVRDAMGESLYDLFMVSMSLIKIQSYFFPHACTIEMKNNIVNGNSTSLAKIIIFNLIQVQQIFTMM